MGYLPKKMEVHKKSMALVAKKETEIHKLKDFEYERIQYTRQALLHFLNAQMLIHAKQFEMYADIFN